MFVIISVLIQLGFAIHVLKTGRKPIWVIIIGFIPVLGCLAYIIVELMPGWTGKRSEQQAQARIKQSLYPEKDLKEALRNLEIADTVNNRTKLAEQYLLREQYQEAKDLYEKCLTGINKTDPQTMLGLATADFGLNNYAETIATLDALKAANPDFKSSDGHLIYARAQEGVGNIAAAMQEYEALIIYYPSPEPTCRFALLLKANGNPDRANELFKKIVDYSISSDRHYNYINEEWVTMAKREMQG